MENKKIAYILNNIADILEIKNENIFKINSYRKSARVIGSMADDINEISKEGPDSLKKIPGVGTHQAERIYELISTGKMTYYEELKKSVDPGVVNLMRLPGMGPRKAKLINEATGASSIDELKKIAQKQKLKNIKGLGAKTEENIIKSIEEYEKHHERILLVDAYAISLEIIDDLKTKSFVIKTDMAGSLRRLQGTVGDIDILVASNNPKEVSDYFTSLPQVKRILAKGKTKSSIIHQSGLEVDLRVVSLDEYGCALQYFTGSKDHSVALRGIAKKEGYKISEYGIFDVKTDKKIGGKTEGEIYSALGMSYIIPQLRENKGEIEAALEGKLPKVVEQKDIKGDLHLHTKYTDGINSIEEIAIKAMSLGYQYIAITDHAERLKFVGGLTVEELEKQAKEINELNKKYEGKIIIFKGSEVNIDNDGNIDYEEEILEKLDIVTASIHSGFGQSKEQLTNRILKAIENPYVNAISHPTGILLNVREPYQLDMDEVLKAAKKTGTTLELNSFPSRLDLNDDYLRKAKKMGVKIAINTDAHAIDHMDYMFYGIATAQRGWLEKEDVVNCWSFDKLIKHLQ